MLRPLASDRRRKELSRSPFSDQRPCNRPINCISSACPCDRWESKPTLKHLTLLFTRKESRVTVIAEILQCQSSVFRICYSGYLPLPPHGLQCNNTYDLESPRDGQTSKIFQLVKINPTLTLFLQSHMPTTWISEKPSCSAPQSAGPRSCHWNTWTTEEPKIFGVTTSRPKNWFYQKPKTENQFFLDFSLYELVLLRNWCSVAFRLINWYSVAFRLVNWYSVAFRLLFFQRGIHGCVHVHVFLVCSFLFCFLLCSFVLFFWFSVFWFFVVVRWEDGVCFPRLLFIFKYIYILYITYCYISLFFKYL